ncbi:hypothetical protein B0H34DRAFT_669394 [Crassisporium funariophilum]|nr:hypothetical protein B0H34DRAFT_669394 [Crassisporium funariophilum]
MALSNGSPAAFLVWAILSGLFLIILLAHLWSFDGFECLKWKSENSGAFKRVMTYGYMTNMPLLVLFSIALTSIKYNEGMLMLQTVIPRPIRFYSRIDEDWLLPLYFILSTAWSLELCTHLEELCYWLFILHQDDESKERGWFQSWEFRTWCVGAIIALLGMPLTTFLTRGDLERVLAWIFLAGSVAGNSTNIAFLYVLRKFPRFINLIKKQGGTPDLVVRFAIVNELNRVRLVFRFFFNISLLIIGIDGVRGPYPIISNFLLITGGIGCFISTAITLFIFFPRSFIKEFDREAERYSEGDGVPTATGGSTNPNPAGIVRTGTFSQPSFYVSDLLSLRQYLHRNLTISPLRL